MKLHTDAITWLHNMEGLTYETLILQHALEVMRLLKAEENQRGKKENVRLKLKYLFAL